jgi:uncharacterized protein (TIRG00374 family)
MWLRVGFRLGVSAVLLALLLSFNGLEHTLRELRDYSAVLIVSAFLLLLSEVLIRIMNWRQLCAAADSPLSAGDAAYTYFVGGFMGAFLPSTLGTDAVRSSLAASRTGRRVEVFIATTVSLNLLSLGALGVLGVVASAGALATGAAPRPISLLAFGVSLAAATGVALLVWLSNRRDGGVSRQRHAKWGGWRGRVQRSAHRFTGALALAHSTSALPQVLAVATLSYAFRLAVLFVLLRGAGADVGVLQMFIAGPLYVIATALPISIAGLGGLQAVSIFVFGSLGAPLGTALAASLAHAALYFGINAIGAVAWALGRRPAVAGAGGLPGT